MGAETRPWWRSLTTVRARTTFAATGLVGLALAVSAISLVLLLRSSLVHHVDDVAEVRAEDIAALAREGPLPEQLATVGDDGSVAQVVTADGRILATSAGIESDLRFAKFRPSGREPLARTVEEWKGSDGGDFRILALTKGTTDGPITIYVASSLDPATDAITTLRGALAAGSPVLLALIAITTWIVVGRALRPVDAISAEVADISERSIGRRVPVPKTDDEIGRLARTMNKMLDRLQKSSEQQRRFVADASHELQTPLASARTDLEVAIAHPEKTDWRQTANDLLAANRRMESLTRDLLFLARADHGVSPEPPAPVDLDEIVLSEASRLGGEAGIEIDTTAVSAAAVLGRQNDLTRVVRNLLENAAKFASSKVTVGLAADSAELLLTVADDGPGIPPEDRARIFERFTSLDEARTRENGGTGLGLAIVKEIIEAHGGSIRVEDSPSGAYFAVRLKAAE